MKLRTLLLALACVCVALVQAASPLSLIPLPASVQQGSGQFTFPAKVQLCVPSYTGDSVKAVAKRWAGNFTKSTGIKVSVGKKANAAIQLRLNSGLAPEAYDLQVTRERIVIEAARPAGFFYALQTLNQLLPSRAVMAGVKATDVQAWTLPVVAIKDHPRFEWRGFMLDEGRHFYGKEEIKKLLDVMAAYKLNRFHWHLTEDQGWRIEIKKYPRLTEVGAWRNSKVLGWGEVKPDGQRYGGYYTQKDAREIVRYAQERFIEIVPEVDIPGHSQAAVAAYPEFLSCDPQNKHEVWLWQGVSPDVINVSHPQAVQFAKDVIDELTAIFPFRYIHLGGDECPTNKWEANEACRQQLASIGSKNFRDLQINFYRQLQDHIAQKPASEQRQLIFWNEVLHGNTRPLGTDITIMAWVGADGAAKDAAQRGMKTILSPQIPYYINRRQSNLPTEPRSQGHGTETVEAVYNYVPMAGIPADLQQQYMGVQANFWTEWVEEASVVQYLMFPRLAAVAEAGWTPQQLRKYPDFLERLQAEAKYYDLRGVDYGKHVFR
ncbi:MAG: beta-N-acetylhexosaminidase [Alloprevotella sp.]|nr:beta-N-acetylhexosaminidase [Bacteroidales bacterium]MDY2914682.1 beta-N-acetylhexosaminidase [Alloprevotella sp.]